MCGIARSSLTRARASSASIAGRETPRLNVTVSRLETHEPNLERVFLHLTGRALRD